MDEQSKPDDRIFQPLAAGYPMHMIWKLSLPNMWDEIERELGHGVRFLTDEQRERMKP